MNRWQFFGTLCRTAFVGLAPRPLARWYTRRRVIRSLTLVMQRETDPELRAQAARTLAKWRGWR